MVMDLSEWEKMRSKPVAILGSGVSGKGTKKLLDRLNWKSKIFDEKGVPLNFFTRECSWCVQSRIFFRSSVDSFSATAEFSLLGEMDFASYFLPKPPVHNRTNGKTTLSSLISHVFKKMGQESVLAGNMGYPLSQHLSESIGLKENVILEISSFQSWDLSILQPATTIWTNFEDDHLDYHRTRENYFDAKLKLCKEQPVKFGWVKVFMIGPKTPPLPAGTQVIEVFG